MSGAQPDAARPADPVGRVLTQLCHAFAAAGGVVLIAITIMSTLSIAGRALFSKPITGDFELVQLACAVCVAAFLPYAQLQRANIIVDFFTASAGPKVRGRLDAIGALLMALVTGLVGWRTAVGATVVYANGETSMLMGVPIWISYAMMAPGFLLTAAVSLHAAWEYWREGSKGAGDE
jgi:TRAP-type C4-dicarboxylate transport system permease small subunit